ncbi:hypothetical protein [Arthrobacter sp. KBS0703]|nr:hypothetical protein [Arthrobacter sp. KBS0703]
MLLPSWVGEQGTGGGGGEEEVGEDGMGEVGEEGGCLLYTSRCV